MTLDSSLRYATFRMTAGAPKLTIPAEAGIQRWGVGTQAIFILIRGVGEHQGNSRENGNLGNL